MDYEKKIREIINSNSEYYPSEDKAVFAKYFPELIESKDEMIKQCLIEHIKCNKDLNWSLFQWFKPDTIIAWLEKQKVTDEEMIFRPIAGTDIRIAAKQALEKIDIGKKVVLEFNGAYIPVNGKTVGEIDSEYDAWLEKQGEKKPVDKVEPKFKVGDKVLCRTTLLNDKPKPVYKIRAVTEDGRYLIVNEGKNGSFAWFRDDELEPYAEPKKDNDMIVQEDYCSFELSKLVKEKGFKCGATYSKGFVKDGDGFVGGLVRHEDKITHQMAMKWLREKHKIDIFIDTDFPIDRMKYTYKIVRIYKDGDKYTDVMGGSFDTYEGAVEAAIKYSLENMI